MAVQAETVAIWLAFLGTKHADIRGDPLVKLL
jgi:hypothetical protein